MKTLRNENGRILIHKKTKQRLLFRNSNSLISTLYILDKNDNKIIETNKKRVNLLDTNGNIRYEMAICLNKNLKL